MPQMSQHIIGIPKTLFGSMNSQQIPHTKGAPERSLTKLAQRRWLRWKRRTSESEPIFNDRRSRRLIFLMRRENLTTQRRPQYPVRERNGRSTQLKRQIQSSANSGSRRL